MTREDYIDSFIRHAADCIPYDHPNYEEQLLKNAEYYADQMLDPNSELNELCRAHDELL